MARKIAPLWILSLILFTSCGSTVGIYSDMDESAMFDQYTTYNFLDFSEGNQKTITGMELERIRVAFARELERRGLSYVEENADVAVKITIHHREAVRGYAYAGRYFHMERAISIDMYDNQSKKHVWHCAAVGELEYDPEERAASLPELVAKIFARYPMQLAQAE